MWVSTRSRKVLCKKILKPATLSTIYGDIKLSQIDLFASKNMGLNLYINFLQK